MINGTDGKKDLEGERLRYGKRTRGKEEKEGRTGECG